MVLGAVMLISQTAFAASEDSFQEAFDRGWLWVHLAALGVGFVTSLTPCVYPMIPIVVGIFGGRDAKSRGHAFALATMYVLGMALLFSILGVGFALAGKQSSQLLANPWVVIPIVLIYVVLAASMFGAFELALPQSWQQRLNQVGGRGYRGAFGMGLVGGLTAAPCTGPFLLGLLVYIGTQGNIVGGMSIMMAFAIGLGILFWVLAVFAVSLPKSGPWMEWFKSAGGIALLGMAIYFLRPIVPALRDVIDPSGTFMAAGLLLALVGILLGAVHLSFRNRASEKTRKGIGVVVTTVGISMVVGWFVTPSRTLEWRHDEAAAFAEAAKTDKLVMVDFGAEWCAPCKEIEKIFAEDQVYDVISERFVPLKFDVTKATDRDYALQEKYDAGVLPAVIFLSADHQELGRFTDKTPTTDEFVAKLKTVLPKKSAANQLAPARQR